MRKKFIRFLILFALIIGITIHVNEAKAHYVIYGEFS